MPEKHSRPTDGGRAFWWTERLWGLARDLPVQRVAIADIAEFDVDCWFGGRPPSCRAIAEHARMIDAANLAYPVILAADGHLMDGGHRIAKAWLDGATHVDAVRFVETPEPDWIEARGDEAGRLVVVCGLPGSGKTTLGRRLELEYGAIRLCPDEWMATLGVDVFDEGARELVEQLQWRLAHRLLEWGQVVVIEWGTWARHERDALRRAARALGAAVELHYLDQPIDVLWARVRGRDIGLPDGQLLGRADIEAFAERFQRPDAEELSLYDAPPHLMPHAPTLALTGRRCVPARLLEADFRFTYPTLDVALQDLLSNPS